jgi:hypothetical protein
MTGYLLAGTFAILLLGGAVAYLFGSVTLRDARTGFLGADWHRRAYHRAYGWFALCAVCWLAVAGLWLAVR